MYIKGFGIDLDKSKRLWGAIFLAILVAIVLIIISFMSIFFHTDRQNIFSKSDLFGATSFYCEYAMNVFSNKNQNQYQMKEWYVKDEKNYQFRIESIMKDKTFFTIVGNNHAILISSDDQISKINLSEYELNMTNVSSVSTFLHLFHKINERIHENNHAKECCKIEQKEIDNKVSYIITLNKEKMKESDCDICSQFLNNGMHFSKFELILKEDKIPSQYIVYDESGKTYLDIVYNNFVINESFEEKLFAF